MARMEKIHRDRSQDPDLRETTGTSKPPDIVVFDDMFEDGAAVLEPQFEPNIDTYLDTLWEANPIIYRILKDSEDLETARDRMYDYIAAEERRIFDIDNDQHILEKATARESIRVLRSIIGPINEKRANFSALSCLWHLAKDRIEAIDYPISAGFMIEFIHLFMGIVGRSSIYHNRVRRGEKSPAFLKLKGREAADARTRVLDELGEKLKFHMARYPSGLEKSQIEFRVNNRKRILKYFGGTDTDWYDYSWQLNHVIRTAQTLIDLIDLTEEKQMAVRKAYEHGIPFGITPYYLSLMEPDLSGSGDHAVRAQVIPSPDYVNLMVKHKKCRDTAFDFMGEHDTSPVDLVTRRYPLIAILKPFNTCAQICVYCQRNWEIDQVLDPNAMADKKILDQAMAWFEKHPSVGEVLVTGGDPCIMKDQALEDILKALSDMEHIYRIRIGTRTPVVLPMRWT
ncbi:KamA family radical SAM protein, partial [bacterium]|nr:KamA family radical SAM protein [candidate division CSSED10-310 bacterium]